MLTGAVVDENGGTPVAIGFRAKKANGHYKYFRFCRVKFGVPNTNLAAKGNSITFSAPSIKGTVLRRSKPDTNHLWKSEADRDDTDVEAALFWLDNKAVLEILAKIL